MMQLSPQAYYTIVIARCMSNCQSALSLQCTNSTGTPTFVTIVILSNSQNQLILYHFPWPSRVSHIFMEHNKPIFHRRNNPHLCWTRHKSYAKSNCYRENPPKMWTTRKVPPSQEKQSPNFGWNHSFNGRLVATLSHL